MGESADQPGTAGWTSSLPLLIVGGVSIVAGGLVAAVTGPAGWDRGAWVAAFLVLVVGVAQVGAGAGQTYLAPISRPLAFVAAEAACWNLGCVAIIVGTLVSSPVAVTIGSAFLVVALVMSAVAVTGSSGRHRPLLWSYRALLVVLVVSIPIGVTLSWT